MNKAPGRRAEPRKGPRATRLSYLVGGHPIRAALLALMLGAGLAPLARAEQPTATQAYTLGPQDKVMLRVFSLRRNSGDTYAWVPLNGPFTVGSDGSLSLPIVGQLPAAGATTAELSARIGETLKEAANLSEAPSVAIEVITYRPFYILGAVQQPGNYEFQPGLTVLQAVSMAQGFLRAADMSGTERDIIARQGEIQGFEAEQVALEARLARLSAEVDGTAGIAFPADLLARAAEPAVTAAMREETEQFKANKEALDTELQTIEDSRQLLEKEIGSLDEKTDALDKQFALLGDQVKLNQELKDKGLTPAARLIDAQSTQVSTQSIMLDVQVSRLRAQQNLSGASRDAVDVTSRYRKLALDGLSQTRAALDQSRVREQTARQLLQAALMRAQDGMGTGAAMTPVYRLVRQAGAGQTDKIVSESTALQAGDVLQVSFSAKEGAATQ